MPRKQKGREGGRGGGVAGAENYIHLSQKHSLHGYGHTVTVSLGPPIDGLMHVRSLEIENRAPQKWSALFSIPSDMHQSAVYMQSMQLKH